MRRASKVDLSQQAIVEGLRAHGFRVEIIGRPVDLLITRLDDLVGRYAKPYNWALLELKTPTKSGKVRKRKDQEKQDEFIRETGTPVVTTLEQALAALNEHVGPHEDGSECHC